MHNTETAKDDFMEAIMEILSKVKEAFYLKSKKVQTKKKGEEKDTVGESNEAQEQKSNSSLKESPTGLTDQDKITRFQLIMKEVIQETKSEDVANIAKTFHDNPKESMKMLASMIEPEINELKKMSELAAVESIKILESVRNNIDPSQGNSLETINLINALISNEEKKVEQFKMIENVEEFSLEKEEVIQTINQQDSLVIGSEEYAKNVLNNFFDRELKFNKDYPHDFSKDDFIVDYNLNMYRLKLKDNGPFKAEAEISLVMNSDLMTFYRNNISTGYYPQDYEKSVVDMSAWNKEMILENIHSQLTPNEKELFHQLDRKIYEQKINEYNNENAKIDLKKYEKMEKTFSVESINKVKGLYEMNMYNGGGYTPEDKISVGEIAKVNSNLMRITRIEKEGSRIVIEKEQNIKEKSKNDRREPEIER